MLCEKCGLREATVKITKIMNGKAEVHNLCMECASPFNVDEKSGQEKEWQKAIFRLLTDAVRQSVGEKINPEENEKKKAMTCPTCGKTYGEFMQDGTFGCSDCYEAFSPSVDVAITNLQGADHHTGKRPDQKEDNVKKSGKEIIAEKLTPEEEAAILQMKLEEALSIEDYESAAKLRDAIKKLREEKT